MSQELDLKDELASQVEEQATSDARRMGRGYANIEDRLRVALGLEAAFQVIGDERHERVRRAIDAALAGLCKAVLEAEAAVDSGSVDGAEEDGRYTGAGYLVAFLLAFASRTPTRDRLHLFTTNYDRLLEDACDRAGLRVVDRFVGSLRPRFRSSRLDVDLHYSPPGIRGEPRFLEGVVRLTKMHGSIDWFASKGDVIRRHVGFGDIGKAELVSGESMLVFPQSSKDLETGFFPYADLFRDFSTALCRPNTVLVIYGYGFGDDHINRIIRDMLTLPSTHIVIISYDEADGRIQQFIRDTNSESQTSLLMGSHFADLQVLVDHYLPKPAIDDLTWRRARLLRNRAIPPSSDGETFDVDTE